MHFRIANVEIRQEKICAMLERLLIEHGRSDPRDVLQLPADFPNEKSMRVTSELQKQLTSHGKGVLIPLMNQ